MFEQQSKLLIRINLRRYMYHDPLSCIQINDKTVFHWKWKANCNGRCYLRTNPLVDTKTFNTEITESETIRYEETIHKLQYKHGE